MFGAKRGVWWRRAVFRAQKGCRGIIGVFRGVNGVFLGEQVC